MFAAGLLVLCAGTPETRAQGTGTIVGRVTESAESETLPGVNVLVVGTDLGVSTGADGRYRIEGVPAGDQIVAASFVGFGRQRREVTVQAGETVELNFDLQESALNLEEVVVTGTAGGQRKRAVGNAVSQLDAAEVVDTAPISSVQDIISGRSPGTVVQAGTGQAGSGSRIRIRGLSSFSLSNQPLLYIDGIRVDNTSSSGPEVQGFGQSVVSRLNDISPQDIKSIEIIKGPAAATLYGTEASNGVIQIITKRGKQGETTFRFTTRQGAQWFDSAEERLPTNYAIDPQTGEVESLNILEVANERGDQVFRTGHTQNYSLSARGGTETVRYYLGGNFSDNEGAEPDNRARRWGARANVSITPTSTVDINTSLGYASGRYDLSRESGAGGALFSLVFASPSLLDTPLRGYRTASPEAYQEVYEDYQEFARTTASIQATHEPLEWFTHRLTAGLDRINEDNVSLAERLPSTSEFASFFGPTTTNGFRNSQVREVTNTTVDYSATADFDLAESLSSSTTAGVQYFRDFTKLVSSEGQAFPAPGLDAIDAAARTFGGSTSIENITLGVFLQEQLALNDRLFLTGAVRADDNSAFGQDFGLVLYPKVSLSWVISEEDFWDISFVNQFKLRGAYGQSGKQPDAFAALRTFEPVTGPEDRPAVVPQFVGNPGLGPERGEEFEIGFDASAFDDRLGAEFTYYNQRTEDAILLRDVAPSTGFPEAQFVNAGEISNSGIEALVRGRPVDAESFAWDLSVNFSTNNNEVVDLIGDQETIALSGASAGQQHRVGFPVASYFERKVVSAEVNEAGQAVNVMCADGEGGAVACAEAPRVYLGRTIPKVEGGVSTTVTLFDRLRLYGLVEFKTGHTKYNFTDGGRCGLFRICEANVRPQNADPVELAAYQNAGLSSASYDDASFAKLRAVSVQYRVPQQWAEPLGAKRVNIGVAARNLYTWTGYPGLDPEGQRIGEGIAVLAQNIVPQLTQVEVSLNLSF